MTITRVYPPALTDAVQNPTEEFDAAVRWFMREGAGEATAKVQARFYAMLASGAPPESTDKPRRTSKPPSSTSAGGATPKPKTDRPAQNNQPDPGARKDHSTGERRLPTVHVDLQIHISPDASTEQIDAIFASMSKHLYGQ